MIQSDFDEISKLQQKIELALEDKNFEALNNLSNELETVVKLVVEDKNFISTLNKDKTNYLKQLIEAVKVYQDLTQQKFKNYTFRVSQSRKMHVGYKQTRG